MITNLLRDNKEQKYLVYDCETCNLNLLDKNYCWNLSYLICRGKDILEEYDTFPWWGDALPISKGAADVTRFNHATYKSKSADPTKILEHFESYLYNPEYLIIAHNCLGFDVYVMNQYRQFLNKKPNYSYINRIIDTNCLSKAMLLERKPATDESLIAFQYKMQLIVKKGLKSSVQTMCKYFNIDFDPNQAHSGLYDIRATFKLFWQLIYKFDI